MTANLPHGWEVVRLSELAHVVSERNLANDDIPVLSMTKYDGFVDSLEYFKKQVFSKDTTNYKVVRRGQFAYATIHLDEGSIDLLDTYEAGLISPMYTVFEPNLNKVDPQFFRALLKSERMISRYGQLGQGSINRRKSIGFKVLGTLDIALPTLPEQKKIDAILGSVDEAIQATQAVFDQTRKVKQGLLQQLLTHGIGHTRFKQTEIGEIPEGWEVVPLNNVAHVQTGLAKGKKAINNPIELPYLRVANVQDGHLNLAEIKTITVPKASIERYRLQPGDVLLTEGGDLDKLGRGDIWRGQIDLCLHQNHVFAVRTDSKRLLPDFLSAQTGSSYGKRYFISCAKQTTNLASINSSQLKAFPVLLPPIKEQEEIVNSVAAVAEKIDREQASLVNLLRLKQGLMQDLLTGHVRVGHT